jgi:hypothetical protein
MRYNCRSYGKWFHLCVVFSLLLPPAAGGVEHQWSMGFGDSADQACLSMATDPSGNVYLTGHFAGSMDFGGDLLTSAGGRDIFLAKFDRWGNHLWSRAFGGSFDQTGYGIAVDSSGDIVLTGSFAGTVDFGGMPLISAGGQDIFVARFNAAGAHMWSRAFGDAADQSGYSIAIDRSGNIILTGDVSGSADFGGGNLSSAGGRDIFLAKFDRWGNHHWSRCFGDVSDQSGCHVAADGSGNVLITGWFDGPVDFGGGPLTHVGGKDMFLAKFDASGTHVWSQGFGHAHDQAGTSVAMDGADHAVVTGWFEGSIDFGGGFMASAGGRDMFLARFDAAGSHLWSQGFGDDLNQSGSSVAVNRAGEIIATGWFEGSVDFGIGPLFSAGSRDIFLAVFGPHGINLRSWAFGDAADQEGTDVAVSDAGSILATGTFAGTVNFGGATFAGMGGTDLYLASFACPGDFDGDNDVDGSDLFLFVDVYAGTILLETFAANWGRVGCSVFAP